MAINMLQENEYVSCPKCHGKLFIEFEHYTLKRINTNSGTKLQKDVVKKKYVCLNCSEDVTEEVQKYEIV